ncbi:MAG: phosphopeptide-binding protein [Saprospiraceae bacterium]|nr:phosphopeptide-binding protein [Saprospiraceae bacterium]
MRLLPSFILVSILFLTFACKQDPSANGDSSSAAPKKEINLVEEALGDTTSKSFTLTAFEPSPDFADASLYAMRYVKGRFGFMIGGETYKLGAQTEDAPQKMCANSAKGQHLHLIVDNEPYLAKYEAEFDHTLPDGQHYVLAFLSRSYHESIKRSNANTLLKVMVEGNRLTKSEPVQEAMVFYSRPKGNYRGKAETDKVMLDFYLNNADMAEGYRVLADINGERYVVDSWQPYYIEGLPMGKNSITLTLVDEKGRVVQSDLNPVTREFTLEVDPLEVQ